jgi:hypothetical protein
MINTEQLEQIVRALPILEHSDPRLLREFQETAFSAQIPKGRDVFIEDDQVDSIALLISGVVRVYKIGETGQEITLYRFGNGESCILTANAILDLEKYLSQTDNAGIQQVFTNLKFGSYNHLSAFTATPYRQTGETYQPQYLSLEAYQAIVNTAGNTGGNGGGGSGGGYHGGRP